MSPQLFNATRNFTDAELRVYYLGFCSGMGRNSVPNEEEFVKAVQAARKSIETQGPLYDFDNSLVAGVKVKAISVIDQEMFNHEGGITLGNIYTIVGRDGDDEAYFIDDAGEKNFSAVPYDGCVKFKIVQ